MIVRQTDLLEMAHDLTDTSRLGSQVDVTNEMEGIVLKAPTKTFDCCFYLHLSYKIKLCRSDGKKAKNSCFVNNPEYLILSFYSNTLLRRKRN